MKTYKNRRMIPLFLSLLMLAMMIMPVMPVMAAGQAPVDLGLTESYAILAGTTITNTGSTVINGSAGGDVGLAPGTAFPGQALATISGTVNLGNAAALAAKNDLITAYDDAAGRTPFTTIPAELGGTTLKPGTYRSATGAFLITGTLTLDADGDPDGVFVFQTATSLIAASGSSVNLIDGARYCRVFWQVATDVTLNTMADFKGHILALNSIWVRNGATVEGQLLARNGEVTLDSNTISNGICAATSPLINVVKTPMPLALPAGGGFVTYTYLVTNPGLVNLSSVEVTDDKVSLVSYVSGDANADGLLQSSEAWTYTGSANLTATTTNTATAKGTGSGIIVTDTAQATVTVTVSSSGSDSDDSNPVPLINIDKTASRLDVTAGQGWITYTYKVTNPGTVTVNDVTVTDDKINNLSYISGDMNNDNRLQNSETWIYTGTANLTETTTNTATAKGSANGITVSDIAMATVVVSPVGTIVPPMTDVVTTTPVSETMTGGQLPKTATPIYEFIFFMGTALTVLGAIGWKSRKHHE